MKTQTVPLVGSTNLSALPFPGRVVIDFFFKAENSVLFDYGNCKVLQVKLKRVWML